MKSPNVEKHIHLHSLKKWLALKMTLLAPSLPLACPWLALPGHGFKVLCRMLFLTASYFNCRCCAGARHSPKRFRFFNSDNAAAQPRNLRDALLHETVVAWVRRRETAAQAKKPFMLTKSGP